MNQLGPKQCSILGTLVLCGAIVMGSIGDVRAQDTYEELDTDELYTKGRELVFEGKRAEGRAVLQRAIDLSPTYWEIRLFSARTLAWDGLRDSALAFIKPVLDADPSNRDAWVLRITVINWDDRPKDMLAAADSALKFHPNDLELMLLKARALIQLERPREAGLIVNRVLDRDPTNKDALAMAEEIRQSLMLNTVSTGYSIDGFSETFDPHHFSYLAYSRRTRAGSLHLRMNGAYRFESTGYQPEIDFYPGLGKGMYAYLNYGYSYTANYPDHRFGAEIYKNLPASFEASGGLRYMYFGPSSPTDSGSHVDIYTLSLGKYIGSWWISGRTYMTPDRDAGATSKSLTVSARFYLLGAENYIGASAGIGFSPDDDLQTDSGDIYFLQSRKVGLSFQKDLSFRTQVGLSGGWAQREDRFETGTFVQVWSGSVSVSHKF